MAAATAPPTREERTEVYYGQENAMKILLQAMANVKKNALVCSDAYSPAFSMGVEPVKRGYVDFKKRGVKVRQIVEITKENVEYCKELMNYVELRHLDNVKGNMAVSETEYVATAILEGATPVTQTIYSNVSAFLDQQRYFFETLWNKAIPAEQRIRELETGVDVVIPLETRIINDPQEIAREIEDGILTSDHWCICSGFGGLELGYKLCVPAFKKLLEKHHEQGREAEEGKDVRGAENDDNNNKPSSTTSDNTNTPENNSDKSGNNIKSTKRGSSTSKVRWITNFDKNGLDLVKFFLSMGISIRHTRNVPLMQFGVGDKKIIATVEEYRGGDIFQTALVSNEPNYVKHYNALFEELWRNNKSIDAQERIKEIEEGVEPEFVEIITDGTNAVKLIVDFAKSVTREAQLIIPNLKTMESAAKLGIWNDLANAANNGADIRIICPLTDDDNNNNNNSPNQELIKEIVSKAPTIKIVGSPDVNAGLFIVDNERYLRAELKSSSSSSSSSSTSAAQEFEAGKKEEVVEDEHDDHISSSIRRVIYSNSKTGVASFKSFFEILWRQIDVYEKLKTHDRMQTEFANIAAHELRTPIQPILGVLDLLKKQKFAYGKATTEISDKQLALLDRNAKRLQKLSSEILDVTRIEAGTLKLDKEVMDINQKVRNVIADTTSLIPQDADIKIEFKPTVIDEAGNPIPLLVNIDRLRMFEVLSNLVRNAIKYSYDGEGNSSGSSGDPRTITITTERRRKDDDENNAGGGSPGYVMVSVKDEGQGISADMLPRLFTKFSADRDKGGTGLGLYIAKNLVEVHGGRIWAKNNEDGKGATFTFTLPLADTKKP
jgi:signal transduction histidine kinase